MAKTSAHRSLRAKIIAWSFVPTAIILSVFAWMAYSSSQKGIGDQAMLEDQQLVVLKMTQVDQAVSSLVNPPAQAIMLEVDTEHGDPIERRAQKIVQETKTLQVFDGGVFFTDERGIVVVTWPNEKSRLLGQDMSGSLNFEFIRNNPGLAVFLNIEPFGPQGEDSACLVLSLQGPENEFAGASYYCFLVRPDPNTVFNQAMSTADFGTQFYLLDGNQRVVYSSDVSQIGTDLSGEEYIQQALADPKKAARVRKGTQDLVLSYVNASALPPEMKSVNWTLMREAEWDEVMRPWLTYRMQLLGLLVLGLVVPVILTLLGTNRITGPIRRLERAAEQMTAGELGQKIEVHTNDEIEALAEQFNLMSARLQESYSSLEKKVADRTRELAIMNSIISTASQSLDLQEILGDALNKTVEQMGFEAGAAFRLDPDPTSTVLVAHRGFEPGIAIDLVSSHATTIRRNTTEHPSEVTTYEINELQQENQAVQLAQSGFRLLVSVPLASKGRTLGLFLLGKREPGQLSPEELSLLRSIGQHVGVAMENARLYEQAEQTAVVAERGRLARELHDAVTQTLFSANLIADVIPRIWKRNPEEGLQNLEELRQLTRGALAEMRTLLLEMRPKSLERSDIKSLLTQLADAFIGHVRVPVSLDIQGDCELTHEVKIAFYRVAQEALHNIAKHSGARQVELRLGCQPGGLNLCIKDDGLGFDLESIPPDHMGIAIMRERASSIGASLKIESQPGEGTTVELDWSAARRD